MTLKRHRTSHRLGRLSRKKAILSLLIPWLHELSKSLATRALLPPPPPPLGPNNWKVLWLLGRRRGWEVCSGQAGCRGKDYFSFPLVLSLPCPVLPISKLTPSAPRGQQRARSRPYVTSYSLKPQAPSTPQRCSPVP